VSAQSITIQIDGKEVSCERGEFLLDVAKKNGVFIPTLCHHEGLPGLGACRLCIVEVTQRGRTKTVTSCIYPVEDGIEVSTQSESIKEQRGMVLTLLHRLAPEAEVVSQMARFMGLDLPRLTSKEDGEKCILCGRCVQACEQLGAGAIAKVNRGVLKAIDTPYSRPSAECIGCASCANVCPTGAIAFEETAETVTIWGRTFDLQRCQQCGRPIASAELLANAKSKLDAAGLAEGAEATGAVGDAGTVLCTVCRRRSVADTLKQVFRV